MKRIKEFFKKLDYTVYFAAFVWPVVFLTSLIIQVLVFDENLSDYLAAGKFTNTPIFVFTILFLTAFFINHLIYKILIKPKVRLKSLIFTIFTILVFIIILSIINPPVRILSNGVLSVLDWLFNISSSSETGVIRDSITLLLSSVLVNTLVYLLVAKLRLVGLFIIYGFLIASWIDAGQFESINDCNSSLFPLLTASMIITVIISIKFILYFKVTNNELIKKISKLNIILFIIGLLVFLTIGFLIMQSVKDRACSLQSEIDANREFSGEREQLERELERLRENQSGFGENGELSITEGFGTFLIPSDPAIAGLYSAETPLYLKTGVYNTTLDTFGLQMLKQTPNPIFFDNYEDNSIAGGSLEAKFIFGVNPTDPLATPERVTQFDKLSYDVNEQVLYSTGDLFSQISAYSLEYHLFDENLLRQGGYNFDGFRTYNSTNTYGGYDRFSEMLDLAFDITANGKSDLEKAQLVESYLIENYEYTLTPGITDLTNPIDDFLFDAKKGYCTYFATSMAILLDIVGVEARVVEGFYSPTYDENLDSYILLTSDLHAWTEVWVDNYGWVTFDPTTYRLDPEFEEDFEPTDITGRARLEHSEPINDNIVPTEGFFGFDDLFSIAQEDQFDFDASPINLGQLPSLEGRPRLRDFDNSDFRDRISDLENQIRDLEENNEEENLPDENDEDLNGILSLILRLTLLIGIILFILIFLIYKLRNKSEKREETNIQKRARKIDGKIRSILDKDFKLNSVNEYKTPKLLIKKLKEEDIATESLVSMYSLIDVILYGKDPDTETLNQLIEEFDDWKRERKEQ